jgi:hypothetical protein
VTEKAEKKRRELAEAIMAGAYHKVEKLGFTMLLSESDHKKGYVKKHHLLFHRIQFIYTGANEN